MKRGRGAAVVEALVRRRVAIGMSQADVAAAMYVSRPTVTKFESAGGHDPRLETLLRYAAAVGADLAVVTREVSPDA